MVKRKHNKAWDQLHIAHLFLLLKYGGADAVPLSVELKGNGRRPRNPSSIHQTALMYSGTKNHGGSRCHALPTQRVEPAISRKPKRQSNNFTNLLIRIRSFSILKLLP
jgi:hypothetical protein